MTIRKDKPKESELIHISLTDDEARYLRQFLQDRTNEDILAHFNRAEMVPLSQLEEHYAENDKKREFVVNLFGKLCLLT